MARRNFEITLTSVHNALVEMMPAAVPVVREVREDNVCPTACVDNQGILHYNREFFLDNLVEKGRVDSKSMACLILHETLHLVFNHLVMSGEPLMNLAADMVINSYIYHCWGHKTGSGKLFRKFYSRENFPENLLRPGSGRFLDGTASRLYERRWIDLDMSTPEVIATLKLLIEQPPEGLTLIGKHGGRGQGKEESETWAEAIQDLVNQQAQEMQGRSAGPGIELRDLMMSVPVTKRAIERQVLEKMAVRSRAGRFLSRGIRRRVSTSPIPKVLSRMDSVLLSAGVNLTRFHVGSTAVGREEEERQGDVAIYIDVSGSMHADVPEIIASLAPYRGMITRCFEFSTIVHETTLDTMVTGRVTTTYGTDFTPVAISIIEENFKKVIIVTDGAAHLDENKKQKLVESKVEILVILFGMMERFDHPFSDICETIMFHDATGEKAEQHGLDPNGRQV